MQFEAGTGWILQLDRETACLGMPSIGKSRGYIRARDGKYREMRPVRHDGSDALDRCAGFGKNPAFDPDNFAGGDFDALDVNPGSFLHFAQAGQWETDCPTSRRPRRGAGLAREKFETGR